MKKIYSLFMVLGIALCAMANSTYPVETSKFSMASNETKATLEKKQIQNEFAIQKDQVLKQSFTKKLSKDRKAVSKKMRHLAPAAKAASADTVYVEAAYFAIEPYPGEWYVGVMNEEETYEIYFDYFSETFTGTFTTEDFLMTYSKIYDYTGEGVVVNFNEVELTITETVVSSTLSRVDLNATIDGSDGKVYVVTGFYETITPKQTIEFVITENTTLQNGEASFAIEGQTTYNNELVTVSALIASERILGEYSTEDFYPIGSFVGFGPVEEMNIIDVMDASAIVTMEEGQYVFDITYLGVDTVQYHTMLYYALPAPTDTIDVVVGNLTIDDALASWFGIFWCDGSNSEYQVSVTLTGYEALDGVYDSQNTSVSLYSIADATSIEMATATAELSTKEDGTRHLVATALSEDNVLYNIDMQFVIPEAKDTIVIDFGTQVGEATFYESWGDYQIYTENDQFAVALDIVTTDLIGEWANEDFDLNYTFVSQFNGTDTISTSVLDAKAVITSVNDSVIDVNAELMGADSMLYQVHTLAKVIIPEVRLDYDEQTGSVDRTYTTEDDVVLSNYIATDGYVTLEVTAADQSDIIGLLFFVEEEDPTTIIPVGTYPINGSQDYGTVLKSSGVSSSGSLTYSVYGTLSPTGGIDKCYFLVEGEVVVSEADGKLKIEVNATNSYDVPVHVVCEYDLSTKQGLQYDMTEGEVNRTYSDADVVEVNTDYISSNQIYLDITAADGSDMISVAFIMNTVDPTITIPAGTYPINDSFAVGSVYASVGVVDGSIYPSFYGQMNAAGQIKVPCYFMVGGNVVVENVNGHLKVTIDALNSYDVPAHIVYEATATSVENVVVEKNANKVIENGQLFIIKEGVKYDVLGNVVK